MPTKLIQWNCNGLVTHLPELKMLLSKHLPFCISIQETHFRPETQFSLRGYTCLRNDVMPRHRARGGVAIFVQDRIPYREIALRTDIQAVAVTIAGPINATICNIYLPDENWNINDIHDLVHQLPGPLLLVGDFNAHSLLWGSLQTDTRGRALESFLDNSDICLVNDGRPTYFKSASGTFSAIDLSLCSPNWRRPLAGTLRMICTIVITFPL